MCASCISHAHQIEQVTRKQNHRWTKIHGPNWTRTKCINKDYQRILCFLRTLPPRRYRTIWLAQKWCYVKTGKWLQAKETMKWMEEKGFKVVRHFCFSFFIFVHYLWPVFAWTFGNASKAHTSSETVQMKHKNSCTLNSYQHQLALSSVLFSRF